MMRSKCTTATAAALMLVATGAARTQTINSELHDFRVVTITAGLEHPWGLAFLDDSRMLVTERGGQLRLITDGQLDPRPLDGVPKVKARGQGGLLDVALDPDFESNRLVYLSYAAGGLLVAGTEVARGRLEGHRLTGVETVFEASGKSFGGRHFGSRLLFTPDGRLIITLGDRGDRPRAQDLGDHVGSTIRINRDGTVPADNPFVDLASAMAEIWTYGNRNVQGIALAPDGSSVWAHEHGPQGGDEINVLRGGLNYGWPEITYGKEYGSGADIGVGKQRPDVAPPVHQWTPSIAPSGMAFYTGDRFPRWRGNLFVGSLKFGYLARIEVHGQAVLREEPLLRGALGRIRDVRNGPDGYLYLVVDAPDGSVVRLEPAANSN